jgi:acyl transferase domain-containing protein/acyl carrier protein
MTMTPAELTAWLSGRIAERTGQRPAEVDVELPLDGLGLGSADTAEIAADLTALLGTEVHPALLFEHPTIAGLATALTGAVPTPTPAPARRAHAGGPVAIVGISARVPGADSVDGLWRLLREGRTAVTEVPTARWQWDTEDLTDAERGARYAGLIEDIDLFDASFFRVPADEAARMDPQQRLLLHGAWEAVEDAGQAPDGLAGSRTGVYVGISNNDYARRQVGSLPDVHALTPTGNALSVAANRLSYLLDLHGPSLAVDTACSSSLVATHLAVRDLRTGACELAIVAGVNLLVEPDVSVALARAGMLAPDGRCKPFSADANGYARGEGCVVVVLKPLARAIADQDRVYAVILGSDVNQDGRSNGLTAPNPAAQQAVLRGAYADAGVDPGVVGYVECHGTGTFLGDPIEARSLGTVLGGRPADRPCLIGSAKANLGHLESAAGLTGLIKAALSLHNELVPRSPHFDEPNPHIDFAGLGLRVADTEQPWPGGGQRVAGVSSFGFGGTNAHVVLGAAPEPVPATVEPTGEPVVIPASARHPDSLTAAAHALADRLDELAEAGPVDLRAVANAAARRRTHHFWRYAVVGRTSAELAAALRDVEPGRSGDSRVGRRVVFACPGQAGLVPSAVLALAEAEPAVAATLRRADEIITARAGWSLLAVLRRPDAEALLRKDTVRAQPAVVAIQLALASAWHALGVRPAEVIGHSIGEVSAAALAGALSLEQALAVALARGRVVDSVIGTGRMLAMATGPTAAEAIAAGSDGRITVAAVNGPASIVLSGDADALEQVRSGAEADGTPASWVPVDYPSHGPSMAGAALALREEVRAIAPATARLPFWSAADGGLRTDPLDADYWAHNLTDTVRFAEAAAGVLAGGPVIVVELATHPVLRTPIGQLAAEQGAEAAFVATLERDADPALHLRSALARLYTLGVDPRWDRLVPATPYLPMPTYPWRTDRHWLPRPTTSTVRARGGHPLLGSRMDLGSPGGPRGERWEQVLTGTAPAAFDGHTVGGRAVLPGAAFLDAALTAGRRLGITGPIEVRDARFTAFLPVAEGPVTVQTLAEPDGDDGFAVTIMSRPDSGDWVVNATATVAPAPGATTRAVPDPATARATCFHQFAPSVFYATLDAAGLAYGPGYRRLTDIWHGSDTAVAGLTAPPMRDGAFVLDPRTLDGALQLAAAAAGISGGERFALTGLDRLVVAGAVPAEATVVARSGSETGVAIFAGDVPLVVADGLRVTTVVVPPRRDTRDRRSYRYEQTWRHQDSPPQHRDLTGSGWLLAGEDTRLADGLGRHGALVRTASGHDAAALLAELREAGAATLHVVYAGRSVKAPDAGEIVADVTGLLDVVKAASLANADELWLLTSGSQAVADAPGPVSPAQAALWGLVRVLPFENPHLRTRCVDTDASDAVDAILGELRAPSAETEIALRGGLRHVARIVPVPHAEPAPDRVVVRPDGGYLITGGLGAIGLRVAGWLAANGAAHLTLLGRTEPDDVAAKAITEIERAGTAVHVHLGDVADPGVVAGALATLRAHGPVRGVAHAAGVLADGPLLDMSADAVAAVFGPKVDGALRIAESTVHDELDWLVYFSSAAAVLGSPGQGNYCAANAFLDAHGAALRAEGRPAVVVDWGAWGEAGLAAGTAGATGRLASAYSALDPQDGIDALADVLRDDRPRTIVLASDLRHLVRMFPTDAGRARFEDLTSAEEALLHGVGLGAVRSARPPLKHDYRAPRTEVERRIAGIWQRSLGFDRVGIDDGFFELGGDSVFANQLVLEVNRTLGVTITAADAFEHLTVAHLAELAEQQMLARLASLSDAEAEALLRETTLG